MKKLMSIFGTILIASFILTSCGGGTKKDNVNSDSKDTTKTVTKEPPKPVTLATLAYSEFKIVNKEKAYYKMADNGKTDIVISKDGNIEITAEFDLLKTVKGKPGVIMKHNNGVSVSLLAIDAQGNSIKLSSAPNGEMGGNDDQSRQFRNFLLNDPGTTLTLLFTGQVSKAGSSEIDKDKTKEAAQKITGFKVITKLSDYL